MEVAASPRGGLTTSDAPMADDQPPFPAPLPGVPRMSHLPSIEAGLRYWRAVRARADPGGASGRTAATLESIYTAAREALLVDGGSHKQRPQSGSTRDIGVAQKSISNCLIR